MWDHFFAFFEALWEADRRPEARRFTLGCAAISLLAVGAIWWYYSR